MTEAGFSRLNSLIHAGRFTLAKRYMRSLCGARGVDWEMWKWRALLAEKMGEASAAKRGFCKALALAPAAKADELRRELARIIDNETRPYPISSASEDGHEHILRITLACNQKCPFCFVALTGRKVPLPSLIRELDVLAGQIDPDGMLTISGGEPGADSRLPHILRQARRRGIRRFSMQTNAVYLARPGIIERLIRLGVRDYFVSFHSHLPLAYDRITASRGQYSKALKGLKTLLSSRECRVVCNVVVNAHNYRHLPSLARFLGHLGRKAVRPPEIFFSMMNEAGVRKAASAAVGLTALAPRLNDAVSAGRRAGCRFRPFVGYCAFPVCVLESPEALAPVAPAPQTDVVYLKDVSEAVPARARVKRPSCRDCRFDAGCLGVPAEYARRFGLDRLSAIRSTKLSRPL